ncbi:hypothetical protein D3C71_1739700 [compost metagenome]
MLYGFASEHLDREAVREEASDLRDPIKAAQEIGHCDDVLSAVAVAPVATSEGRFAAAQHVEPVITGPSPVGDTAVLHLDNHKVNHRIAWRLCGRYAFQQFVKRA